MRIAELQTQPDCVLSIVADDGRIGKFDVSPYLEYEAFNLLQDKNEFAKVFNGGYFVEWDCGADLSADTIEAQWNVIGTTELKNSCLTGASTGTAKMPAAR
jgi:hypothetical protein